MHSSHIQTKILNSPCDANCLLMESLAPYDMFPDTEALCTSKKQISIPPTRSHPGITRGTLSEVVTKSAVPCADGYSSISHAPISSSFHATNRHYGARQISAALSAAYLAEARLLGGWPGNGRGMPTHPFYYTIANT